MSTITFECNVTEFDIIPVKENDENAFCINDKCFTINLMNTQNDRILIQTEIERNDAIKNRNYV